MTIRDAAPEDLSQVAALEGELFRHHGERRPDVFRRDYVYSRREFDELLSHPGRIALVAEEKGRLVGLCFGRVEEGSSNPVLKAVRAADLEDLVVVPSLRGRGLGRALLEEAKARAAGLGAERVRLRVWAFNENAERLYRALGFEPQWSEMEYDLGNHT